MVKGCFPKAAARAALACSLLYSNWLPAGKYAETPNVLHFDDPSTRTLEQYYAPQQFLKEKDSIDLERKTGLVLLNYSTMSNAAGERWALIQVRNMSGGSLILTGQNVTAIFANGDKKPASAFKQQIGGDQVLSKSVSFGVHRFPIVRVEVR